MTEPLAPSCYVCRLLASSLRHSTKDDVFIVAYTVGFAEAATKKHVDWVHPDVCAEHKRKFEKAVASVARQLKPEDSSDA